MIQVNLSRHQLKALKLLAMSECKRIREQSGTPFYIDGSPYGTSVVPMLKSAITRINIATVDSKYPREKKK